MKKFWKTISITAIIFVLSTANISTGSPTTIPLADKIVHFLMYATLAFIFLWDMKRFRTNFYTHTPTRLVVIIIPMIYGGIIEVVQTCFFAPRTAEWLDWLADILGVLLGWGVSKWLLQLKKSSDE